MVVGVLVVVGCGGQTGPTGSPTPLETPNPNAVYGGNVTVGIWQDPGSFLFAGITNSISFSYATDAPSAEGLLWYRSTTETASAQTPDAYWRPWLATEVPTLQNGDVRTSGCPESTAAMCVKWKLQPNVLWHDGSQFSSKDVCDTFKFWFLKYGYNNPTATQSPATTGWDQVIGCDETDNLTADVSFKSQYGPYLSLGSGVYGLMPASILEQAFNANAGKGADLEKTSVNVDLSKGTTGPDPEKPGSPVTAPDAYKGTGTLDTMLDGTGPFVFKSYTPGQSVVFVRNHHYWNPNHQPHIDQLTFRIEPNLSTEVTDAKLGKIDVGLDLRLPNLAGLDQASKLASAKFNVMAIPDAGAEKIDFNLCAADPQSGGSTLCGVTAKTSEYTADPTLRKAMLMGLDRKAIIKSQVDGMTTIPPDSSLALGANWIADTTVGTTAYDLVGANALLDQKGFLRDPKCGKAPDGQPFRTLPKDGTCVLMQIGTTSDSTARVNTETLVETDAGKMGLKVAEPFVPNEPSQNFFDLYSHGGPIYTHNFDMAMYSFSLLSPGEPDGMYPVYHGNCGGSCAADNQIPADGNVNKDTGENGTGINDHVLDQALQDGRSTVDPAQRAAAYKKAEHQLAQDLPEIPLYQSITVDTYTTALQDVLPQDHVWDYNTYDWFCTAGKCQ